MERDGESNFKDYAACGFMAGLLLKTPDDPINASRLACPGGCA
jgi:hypothetical protein